MLFSLTSGSCLPVFIGEDSLTLLLGFTGAIRIVLGSCRMFLLVDFAVQEASVNRSMYYGAVSG